MGEIGAARAKFLRASSPRLAKKEGHPVSAWVPLCVVRGSLLSVAKSSVAIHRNICYSRSAWDTMRESAKKRYKVGCFAAYRENSLQSERLHFRQGEKPLFSGGWPFPGSLDFLFT